MLLIWQGPGGGGGGEGTLGENMDNPFIFFPAEDGIRGAHESRGLGDVCERQATIASDV